MLKINDRKWKGYKIIDVLGPSFNAKAYHSNSLKSTLGMGIPYVTRTSLNNGLFSIVENDDYIMNPKDTISFGAENAEYFYQPYEYITGNKMYYYKSNKLNYYSSLFIVSCLNKSIKDCGFGYGMGLTGTRSDTRTFMLPTDKKGNPDYEFMEQFIKEREEIKKKEYIEYAKKNIKVLKSTNENGGGLKRKVIFKLFHISEIFDEVERGKRLIKERQIKGNIPYASSSAMNNGIDAFIGNKENVREFENCLSLANSGSVGSCFYEPFKFIASDHVTHLKNKKLNQFHYLFLAAMLNRLKEKYNFNREINDDRIKREFIMLPVDSNQKPNYKYMEILCKKILSNKYNDAIEFFNIK